MERVFSPSYLSSQKEEEKRLPLSFRFSPDKRERMNIAEEEQAAAAAATATAFASLALFESQLAKAQAEEEGGAGSSERRRCLLLLLHRLHANASAAALAAGLPERALQHARQALSTAQSVEEEAKALYHLARAALLSGDDTKQEAISSLERALELLRGGGGKGEGEEEKTRATSPRCHERAAAQVATELSRAK